MGGAEVKEGLEEEVLIHSQRQVRQPTVICKFTKALCERSIQTSGKCYLPLLISLVLPIAGMQSWTAYPK